MNQKEKAHVFKLVSNLFDLISNQMLIQRVDQIFINFIIDS